MHAIFRNSCPNCEGDIDDDRLLFRVPCEQCLPIKLEEIKTATADLSDLDFKTKIASMLKQRRHLKNYGKLVDLDLELLDFEDFFHRMTGSHLWSAQKTWARRILNDQSFAVIAPTGLGKTLFGVSISIYLANKGRRCYLVLPTTLLVDEVSGCLIKYSQQLGLNIRIAYVHSELSKKDHEKQVSRLSAGDFDILVTTPMTLSKHFDQIKKEHYDFIVVDDVDALLRQSNNIDRALMLLGFDKNIIDVAIKLIEKKFYLMQLLETKEKEEKIVKVREEIEILQKTVNDYLAKNQVGQLIVSSATGRARGIRVRLFRELLGFEAGSVIEYLRNIQDSYTPQDANLDESVLKLINKLGGGGLVFVAHDIGADYAKKLTDFLVSKGVKAAIARSKSAKTVKKFVEGEVDVLVGMASYYGVIVRGIDFPQRIRYAIFAGVPKFEFSMECEENHPARLMQVMAVVQDFLDSEEKDKASQLVNQMRKILLKLWPNEAHVVSDALAKNLKLEGNLEEVRKIFAESKCMLNKLLEREDIRKRLEESPLIIVRERKKQLVIVVPDIMTYIQASGRTSRMFVKGLTKGLSIILVDDQESLDALIRQSKYYIEDVNWKNLNELNLTETLSRIDKDRETVKKVICGKIQTEMKDQVKSALFVVESPNKALTIANFFGKPSKRRFGKISVYEVCIGDYLLSIVASGGHILDLATKEGVYGVKKTTDGKFVPIYTTIKRCLICGDQFTDEGECPRCREKTIPYRDSLENVHILQKLAAEVEQVFLCTDPDAEGEKISWDIRCLIAPYAKQVQRAEFHEVTKKAIYHAIYHPREINDKLVEAQMVRRIEDRWIGFKLTEELQRKYRKPWLSAGRVQVPVVGWIIDRYEQWNANKRNMYAVSLANGMKITLDNVPKDQNPDSFVENLRQNQAVVKNIKTNIVEVRPPPPFTTDELLYEANSKVFIGAMEAMMILQQLFETGFITYHRTDSMHVSTFGMGIARDYLTDKYGAEKVEKLYRPRNW
ncbi:MAG TPA: reverse gyrase, partial [archaeon]|nr:reverse gyrase [archaeon]